MSRTPAGRQTLATSLVGDEILQWEEFLPYRLSICAHRVSDALANCYSERFRLSIPEARILTFCAEYPNRTAKDFCAHSGMNKTVVSRGVASLVARRYILRSPNKADQRQEFLSLSIAGTKIYRKLVPVVRDFEARVRACISESEFKAFDAALSLLMAHF